MKKALKIIGISLASLVGLILLVVGIACYIVFTPKRLTPIVKDVVGTYVSCDYDLHEVNLTFFRTFPYFGVSVQGLTVVNPTSGAPSDTVLNVPEAVVAVDIKKAIDGDIVIHDFSLQNIEAALYIDADGKSNFDVLQLPKDTTEKQDTTAGWQLRSIKLEKDMCAAVKKVRFIDEKDSIDAMLQDIDLCVLEWRKGYQLNLAAGNVCCRLQDTQWADSLQLSLVLPASPTDDTYHCIELGEVQLAVNEFAIDLTGKAEVSESWTLGSYDCQLNIQTNPWRISSVLALLPEQYQRLIPKEIEADGTLQLEAAVAGRYDSVSMPLVDAHLRLKDAAGHYDKKVLPYDFEAVEADVQTHIDLNDKQQTSLTLNRVYARTGVNTVAMKGSVKEVLKNGKDIAIGNPLCKASADIALNLPDVEWLLPKDEKTHSQLKGNIKGTANVQCRLNDVLQQNFQKITLSSKLNIQGLDVVYADSTIAVADNMNVTLTAPRTDAKDKKNILSADCTVDMDNLHANLLAQDLDAKLKNVTLTASIEKDVKDTIKLPTVEATFNTSNINARMDTITAMARALKGKVRVSGSGTKKNMPSIAVTLNTDTLRAEMGNALKARTGKLALEANALYRKGVSNVLLQWNPRIQLDLANGSADIAAMDMPVEIPKIRFKYSNENFNIDTSRIVLGNSDFSLSGNIKNLGKYIRRQGDLVGDLSFTSAHTDVNELIALSNKFNTDTIEGEVTETPKATDKKSNKREPFMVPQRVNLQLLTVIRSADIFDQHLRNLGGKLYIQDGKLILEEMGFICEAAKLQLTAMYRTPRRNHIYVGLDYHMVDIDLQQLISMIPQLDTLVPMLKSFRGQAQFHIAAETYVNDRYELKPSTLRGACSVEGKDLVLIDNDTFRKMSKILMFSTKTENKFDSLSAQIVAYKDQVTIYPFCMSIDNYMAALGGTHNLDMSFDYHVSLLKPLYIGVDVKGTMDNLNIRPVKCRYAQDFRPIIRRDTETRSAELRQMVSNSLKKNLKIQSEQ